MFFVNNLTKFLLPHIEPLDQLILRAAVASAKNDDSSEGFRCIPPGEETVEDVPESVENVAPPETKIPPNLMRLLSDETVVIISIKGTLYNWNGNLTYLPVTKVDHDLQHVILLAVLQDFYDARKITSHISENYVRVIPFIFEDESLEIIPSLVKTIAERNLTFKTNLDKEKIACIVSWCLLIKKHIKALMMYEPLFVKFLSHLLLEYHTFQVLKTPIIIYKKDILPQFKIHDFPSIEI